MEWDKYAPYARPLTRIGISFVFLWFGVNQIFNPSDFMGYLPEMILALESASTIVVLNGVAELVLGLLLLFGKWTRFVALVLALHLVGIISSLGYNDIAVRDVGLFIVTVSIALGGADKWCVDRKQSEQ
jgi:uncharacterized membrane protein YphA (DoxX/SURF4 family)